MRKCVCCGSDTATKSIPACWEHWNILPLDLRSKLIMSFSRGEVGRYGNYLLRAVSIWRGLGAWSRGA